MAEPIITKSCSVCQQEKPLDAFHRKPGGRLGRTAHCKACRLERVAKSQANPPVIANATKWCGSCETEKPASAFRRQSDTIDGLSTTCSECRRAYHSEYAKTPKGRSVIRECVKRYRSTPSGRARARATDRRHKNSENGKKYAHQYNSRPGVREMRLEVRKRSRTKFPEREQAHRRVRTAVANGRLPHPKTLLCSHCGNPATEYHHHRGYSEEFALDVVPVCKPCHGLTRQK